MNPECEDWIANRDMEIEALSPEREMGSGMSHNGLDLFQFSMWRDNGRLVHGIFGRSGGVSPKPFHSLNVGSSVGDDPENVRRNHELVCETLNVRCEQLVTVYQVHSAIVCLAGAKDRGCRLGELDGMVTDEPEVPLILRFADCVPLLAYDPRRHVLGMAHAGWRGTLAKIGANLIEMMIGQYGCRAADIQVGIGPSIGPCCYEVGPEVVEATKRVFGRRSDRVLLSPAGGDRQSLNLWEANRMILEESGIECIEVAGLCTSCLRDRFFSHRGDHGRTGRFPMVAMLR